MTSQFAAVSYWLTFLTRLAIILPLSCCCYGLYKFGDLQIYMSVVKTVAWVVMIQKN